MLAATLVALVVFWSCFASLVFTGCTVTPKVVHGREASFDAGPVVGRQAQNSGLLGHDAEGNGIVTLHAVERYNALIDKFGARFNPPLNHNQGVYFTGTNTALMPPQSLYYFATMNRWLHQEGSAARP